MGRKRPAVLLALRRAKMLNFLDVCLNYWLGYCALVRFLWACLWRLGGVLGLLYGGYTYWRWPLFRVQLRWH